MYEVRYNTEFHRWEVYREGRNVIRGGEVQPVFVSECGQDCVHYVKACERRERA